jgi:hypothetical protein
MRRDLSPVPGAQAGAVVSPLGAARPDALPGTEGAAGLRSHPPAGSEQRRLTHDPSPPGPRSERGGRRWPRFSPLSSSDPHPITPSQPTAPRHERNSSPPPGFGVSDHQNAGRGNVRFSPISADRMTSRWAASASSAFGPADASLRRASERRWSAAASAESLAAPRHRRGRSLICTVVRSSLSVDARHPCAARLPPGP